MALHHCRPTSALRADFQVTMKNTCEHTPMHAGRTQALLQWYATLQALLSSSCALPSINSAVDACAEGLRVSYSAEVLQACWSVLKGMSVPGKIDACTSIQSVVFRSFQIVAGMEVGLVLHEGCMPAFLSWLTVRSYACVPACVCVCMYACLRVMVICMRACMCVCTYIYILDFYYAKGCACMHVCLI